MFSNASATIAPPTGRRVCASPGLYRPAAPSPWELLQAGKASHHLPRGQKAQEGYRGKLGGTAAAAVALRDELERTMDSLQVALGKLGKPCSRG